MKHIIVFLALAPLYLFSQNLTGVWKCDDGATYYIRHIGNELWWYGDGKPHFTNVVYGTVSGNDIQVNWADVPAGRLQNNGKMTLRIVSANELRRTWPNYKGWSVWTRTGTGSTSQPLPPPVTENTGGSEDIGNYWEFEQLNNGYTGTWTRIGNTNRFDGVLSNGTRTITSKVEMIRNGNKITIKRIEASNNTFVWYEGTFEPDGVTINGSYCYASGKLPAAFTPRDKWRATMRSSASAPAVDRFSGTYDTNHGKLVIEPGPAPGRFKGTYENNNGVLTGFQNGNQLKGTWYNSYSNRDGTFVFTFSVDYLSFTGFWGYGNDRPNKKWDGKKR